MISDRGLLDERGITYLQAAVTRENYRDMLKPLLTKGDGQGFCVNLSVDTSSLDLMEFCRELGVLYIDTVVEPWLGFYWDTSAGAARGRTMRCVKPCWLPSGAILGVRRQFPAAVPIRAWSPGSSNRRW